MSDQQQDEMKRFAELVPWYVNGTLTGADRAWVERYLEQRPEARAELEFWNQMRDSVREQVHALPPAPGRERLLTRIRQNPDQSVPPPRSIGERLREWLGLHLTPTFGGALAVIALQAVVIGALVVREPAGEQDYAEFRSAPALPPAVGPLLKASIRPDAKEEDIRLLLLGVGGSIVAGPGQLGDYYIRVAPDTVPVAVEKLQQSDLVQLLEVIPGLPGAE